MTDWCRIIKHTFIASILARKTVYVILEMMLVNETVRAFVSKDFGCLDMRGMLGKTY